MSLKAEATPAQDSASEVFKVFLKLGLSSFGGPVAHIAYFRKEFVQSRKWLSEGQFAQLLAICQFLPGPASSQLGFSIGLLRAGWAGALAAFLAFTLPSVFCLLLFAHFLPSFTGDLAHAALHGLKLVACVVVIDAVWKMARSLCPDPPRLSLALASFALLASGTGSQWLVVILGAIVGGLFWRLDWLPKRSSEQDTSLPSLTFGKGLAGFSFALFLLLLFGLPMLGSNSAQVSEAGIPNLAAAFYQTGAMVFGGGHVVLPLLQESVVGPGWVSEEQFLAGYGAAQAIPGPLFSFSAYLGGLADPDSISWTYATVALLCIFLPGFLLIVAMLPYWSQLARVPVASGALAGVNAAVVGLLAAALYDPVLSSALLDTGSLLIVLVGLGMLLSARVSVLLVVAFCVLASVLIAL